MLKLVPGAEEVVFECTDGKIHVFPLEEAATFIFKFSQDGKPLVEDGPVHILFADGSNIDQPIKNVIAIRVQ